MAKTETVKHAEAQLARFKSRRARIDRRLPILDQAEARLIEQNEMDDTTKARKKRNEGLLAEYAEERAQLEAEFPRVERSVAEWEKNLKDLEG